MHEIRVSQKTVLTRLAAAAMALFLLCGCAPVISKQTLAKTDREAKFSDIIARPGEYAGKNVVLGGTIIGVENLEDRTMLEVLQQELSSQLRPGSPESSAGRFLVEFKGFKDPAVYREGRRITVAGEVSRYETRKLGRRDYTYPVIVPAEDHLWSSGEREREPSIGIGLGLGFGYTHFD